MRRTRQWRRRCFPPFCPRCRSSTPCSSWSPGDCRAARCSSTQAAARRRPRPRPRPSPTCSTGRSPRAWATTRWPPWSRASRRARRLAPRLTPPQPHPPTPASTPASASAPHPHPPARAGAPRRRRALFLRRVGRRADRDQVAAALLPARAVAPRRCAGPTPPHARRAARRAGRQEGLQDLRGDELAAAQRARAARGHVRDERRPRAPRPPRAGRAGVASVAWVGSLPPRARGSAPRTGQCGRARTRSGGGRTFFLFGLRSCL